MPYNRKPFAGSEYKLIWETINTRNIDQALRLQATRGTATSEGSVFEALLWFRRRACKVRDGVGLIPVISWESDVSSVGFGRSYTGLCSDMKRTVPPAPIQRELERGIPDLMAGESAFSFSRVVK